ncbi:MAG: ThuA domain-containing protein [Cyclobacteriaceae bacterium]|nr:ThuA domain-containing protein [Cyclobacteriaceae bacterium]
MIYYLFRSFVICWLLFSLLGCDEKETKKIVILAGEKSHPATMHEYIKNARLIKVMLDGSPDISGLVTEIHGNGWPEDESALLDADLILTISDGRDGPNGLGVPFMTEERMAVLRQAIEAGSGFMTFHYSTFAPDRYGEEMLLWSGGYFDWQNDKGEREWYSDIRFLDQEVSLINPEHPVMHGVMPFQIYEEYYFDLRFREENEGFVPLIEVPGLGSEREWGNVVAWALNREDGGRGFGTTMGHLYANWKNEDYRKFLLNAIVWTAGMEVPPGGISSDFYSDREVTGRLYGKDYKALILTGSDHPAHQWEQTVPVLKSALESGGRIHADISRNINDLFQYDLRDYDFLAFYYANWEDPDPLWEGSKKALIEYVNSGGSLMFVHFANGAFHESLPGAEASDWPEYRKFCRRVWDHSAGSSHDKYGTFEVRIVDKDHELTSGIGNFEVTDELYYNQAGEEPIHVLMSATSLDTGKEEPLAWVYELNTPGGRNVRVFQTVLGHDSTTFKVPEFEQVLNRTALWLSRGTERWNEL